jgi:serine/threonine-protein kinase
MSQVDAPPDSTEARARAAREALIGKTVAGRYVVRRLIGHGGMGAVYEAEHLGLGKRVAIKFVDPEFATDDQVVGRFAREARAMSSIESAHIVTVFDAGTEDGRPYLVMELLRGEDLGQRLRRARRVPLPDAMHVVAQVLKGLSKAHAAGIVHRDLKPDNVFLVKSDLDPLFAKIVDFGMSKIERPRNRTAPLALTGRGTILGTPFYMSPEQAQAKPDVDARADLYSVGAILFECLSGRPPHTGETYEQVILSICMHDAPDLRAIEPSVPQEVAAFVARALARDRADRFASAERMLAALHEIAPDEKKRVPLELPSDTLLTAGVAAKLTGNETRLVGSLTEPEIAALASSPNVPRTSGRFGERTTPDGSPLFASEPRTSQPAPARATPVEPARAAPVTPSSPSLSAEAGLQAVGVRAPRRKTSITAVIVTAVFALLTGVGVMLGLISLIGKKPDAPAVPSPQVGSSQRGTSATLTSRAASAAPTASARSEEGPSAPAEPAEPSSSAARATAPATAQAKPAAPRTSGAKPAPTKLDIARELP